MAFVGSRLLFPIHSRSDKLNFNSTNREIWQQTITAATLLGSPFLEVDEGLFRRFRLRCTYYGESATNAFQLSFLQGSNPFPTTNLLPNILTLPAQAIAKTSMVTNYTTFFTVNTGTQSEIDPFIQEDGTLSVRYHGSDNSNSVQACLYEVVLECWDMTGSSTGLSPILAADRSLSWTRDIIPSPNAQQFPLIFTEDFQQINLVQDEWDITTGTDIDRFPLALNMNRSFKLRTICAMTDPTDELLVSLYRPAGEGEYLLHQWQIKGIWGDGVKHSTVISLDSWPDPSPFSPPFYPRRCSFEIQFRTRRRNHQAILYGLALEAHDHARDGNDDSTRVTKTCEKPLITQVVMLQSNWIGYQYIGNITGLFTSGMHSLGGDSKRSYRLRLNFFNQSFNSTGKFTVRLKNSSSASTSLEFFLTFQANFNDSGAFTSFDISTPIVFGDGRSASLPRTADDNWDIYAKYEGRTIFTYVTGLVLEATDGPISSLHAPSTHTQSLTLLSTPLSLPLTTELVFASTPFSVCMWVMNLGEFYDVEGETEQTDTSKHPFFVGNSFEMGLFGDGSFYATMTTASSSIDFTWADQRLDNQDEWRHVALIWDTQVVQLAVDGKFQPNPQAFTSSLAGTSKASQLGSTNFDGCIRLINIWSIALTNDKLQSYMYRTVGNAVGLIANIEFLTHTALVNSNINAIRTWSLPNTSRLSIQSYALAVAPNGCACLGSSPALHMTGSSSYTLEAWIAICVTDAVDPPLRVVAGKLDSISQGYAIGVKGAKVAAWRNGQILISDVSLVVNGDQPVWRHICCVFDSSKCKHQQNLTPLSLVTNTKV
jgi:Concanavalin A-like lectin/glucanases superfamily